MKPLDFVRKPLALAVLGVALCASLLLFVTPFTPFTPFTKDGAGPQERAEQSGQAEQPEAALAAKRLGASIALGWGWLHAEDIVVRSIQPSGDDSRITFTYTVVVDKEAAALSLAERERYFKFLPMCGEAALRKNGRCALEETLLFTRTKDYGWMPKLFAELVPELLPKIQRASESGTTGGSDEQ